jgi:hypothetical protein
MRGGETIWPENKKEVGKVIQKDTLKQVAKAQVIQIHLEKHRSKVEEILTKTMSESLVQIAYL